jgi:membrane protein
LNSTSHRGREADRPEQIPARGWWDITWRVAERLGSDNISLVAGGLALYSLLAVFPGFTALVSIYGLFASPRQAIVQMQLFSGVLPPGVWDLFKTQLVAVTQHSSNTLTSAAAIGVVVSLWSARSAMSSLMTATNIAYGEREKRGLITQLLLSFVFTIGAMLGIVAVLLLGIGLPAALTALGISRPLEIVLDVLRFVVLWAVATVGLAVVYRFAPSREHARWQWVTWGSVIAASLWIASSALFGYYVATFAHYGRTYGALGGVIALVMWFYLSSIIVVLGAEINAEMERQTRRDTTRRDAPLGQRGAYAADTVGPRAGQKNPRRQDNGLSDDGATGRHSAAATHAEERGAAERSKLAR